MDPGYLINQSAFAPKGIFLLQKEGPNTKDNECSTQSSLGVAIGIFMNFFNQAFRRLDGCLVHRLLRDLHRYLSLQKKKKKELLNGQKREQKAQHVQRFSWLPLTASQHHYHLSLPSLFNLSSPHQRLLPPLYLLLNPKLQIIHLFKVVPIPR